MAPSAYLVTCEPLGTHSGGCTRETFLVRLSTPAPQVGLPDELRDVIRELANHPGVDAEDIRVWALTNLHVEERREVVITGDVL